jgi:hypothetical protein
LMKEEGMDPITQPSLLPPRLASSLARQRLAIC